MLLKPFIVITAILALAANAYGTEANKTIRIAAPYITSLIEEDQSGVYQKIMKRALIDLEIESQEFYSPYKRALLSFEKKKVDCIYSFTNVMQEKLGSDNIIYSFPLGAFAYYIFTNSDRAPIIDPLKLEGLSVGAVYGHENYYQHQLTTNTSLIMVNSDKQNLQKLSLNRIDAMIGALPDLMPFLGKLNFSPTHPLIESYDRITCHKTESNQNFLDRLSIKLEALKMKGIYREIAKDLYFNFDNEKAKQQYK